MLFGITLGEGGLGKELRLGIWYRSILSVGYLPSPELCSYLLENIYKVLLEVFPASELAQLTWCVCDSQCLSSSAHSCGL